MSWRERIALARNEAAASVEVASAYRHLCRELQKRLWEYWNRPVKKMTVDDMAREVRNYLEEAMANGLVAMPDTSVVVEREGDVCHVTFNLPVDVCIAGQFLV